MFLTVLIFDYRLSGHYIESFFFKSKTVIGIYAYSNSSDNAGTGSVASLFHLCEMYLSY